MLRAIASAGDTMAMFVVFVVAVALLIPRPAEDASGWLLVLFVLLLVGTLWFQRSQARTDGGRLIQGRAVSVLRPVGDTRAVFLAVVVVVARLVPRPAEDASRPLMIQFVLLVKMSRSRRIRAGIGAWPAPGTVAPRTISVLLSVGDTGAVFLVAAKVAGPIWRPAEDASGPLMTEVVVVWLMEMFQARRFLAGTGAWSSRTISVLRPIGDARAVFLAVVVVVARLVPRPAEDACGPLTI